MSKIVTITFSPSIDKTTAIPALIPETKLRCANPKMEPGGGGINVARVIKKLGGEVTAVFPSGGYMGKFFNHMLQRENVPAIAVHTINETRESIVVLEESTNNQYRFGMPGVELFENEWKQCVQVIEKLKNPEFIVASGSLPPGVPLDIYGRLAKVAKNGNAKFVVDTSGEALKHAAEEGVYLLKPNLSELGSLVGVDNLDIANVEEVAKSLIHKSHAEVIVVSLGADGAILVTENETYRAKPPAVDRKSTVGAGDSMVAGIVWSLHRGMNLKQALHYGVACGTAATMNPGTELCHLQDVENIFNQLSKV